MRLPHKVGSNDEEEDCTAPQGLVHGGLIWELWILGKDESKEQELCIYYRKLFILNTIFVGRVNLHQNYFRSGSTWWIFCICQRSFKTWPQCWYQTGLLTTWNGLLQLLDQMMKFSWFLTASQDWMEPNNPDCLIFYLLMQIVFTNRILKCITLSVQCFCL